MYIPLFIHSYFSLLRGLNSPTQIIEKAKSFNMSACALTDINSMAGCVEFYKKAKDNNINPIIGILATLENFSTVILIALNESGYKTLLKINSRINSPTNFKYNQNYLDIDYLKKSDLTNIVCITGHDGSSLYNELVENFKIKKENNVFNHLKELINLFKNNLYIELQFSENDKLANEIKYTYLNFSKDLNIKLIACPRVYYLNKEDKELHHILLSIDSQKSLDELKQINGPFYKFFEEYKFYLPSLEEFKLSIDNEIAINNTLELANKIEDYNILKSPSLPKFKSPNNLTSTEYFKQLCRDGWKNKIQPILKDENQKKIYGDRVKHELEVLEKAELFDYFLILHDIVKYAKNINCMVGPGRGSSSGCIVSLLLDITQIDPIKYNLLFERFFSVGRTNSLPDIDIDFEARYRDKIIEYIIKKYGKKYAAPIATYGTLAGKAALKAVFRAYKDTSFSEQNLITKNITDKHKISDQLQEIKDEGGDPSIIKWALKNNKGLKQWCWLNDKNEPEGPLAEKFKKAIKLEGVKIILSRHAAGVVVSPTKLSETVPMIFDPKEKREIIGLEMNDLESCGLIKIDALALSSLDRLKDINEFI